MCDKLPNGLQNIFSWILPQFTVQSWRLTKEQNLVLSIRFKELNSTYALTPRPILEEQLQATSLNEAAEQNCAYRSKPPSCYKRDRQRMNKYNDMKKSSHTDEFSQDIQVGDDSRCAYENNNVVYEKNVYFDDGYKSDYLYSADESRFGMNTTSHDLTLSACNHESCIDANIVKEVSIQTLTPSYAISTQTDSELIIDPPCDVQQQFPIFKKKGIQTNKVSTWNTPAQTTPVIQKDFSFQCRKIGQISEFCAIFVTLDQPFYGVSSYW